MAAGITSGFTLIELMIVLAVIAIILTLAIPTYSNYSIRTKIGEALSLSEATKAVVAAFCKQDRSVGNLKDHMAGIEFPSSKFHSQRFIVVELVPSKAICSSTQMESMGVFKNATSGASWTVNTMVDVSLLQGNNP